MVAQSCLTLCDPMDCSPPGCSVRGILQARILEWVVMPSSRGSSWSRDLTHVSYCYDKPRQCIKKQRHYFADKGPYSQSYGFSISHVQIWELDLKEILAPNNWCFWTVVLEKTLENPLDFKKIKRVNPKGNQSWIFIGRAEADAPLPWAPDAKNWLFAKDPDPGKDWRQEEKGMTEDEMVGWHHRLDGHEFEQALGDGKGQGSLACCSPWSHKE